MNTSFVASSGGSFRITPKGACVDGATFIVTDQTGRTVTVTASNKLGTTVPVAAFFVTPTSVSLGTCTDTANVIAGGGSGTYAAAANSGLLLVTVSGSIVSISRKPGTNATGATGLGVTVTDGKTAGGVSVGLTGTAAGNCP